MLRKAAVAGALAALLLGAPAAYADGEDQGQQQEQQQEQLAPQQEQLAPQEEQVAPQEPQTVPLIVASATMTSEFAVPMEDVEALRTQLQNGFLREDVLGCFEHPESRVVVEGTQEEQCEPATIVTAAVENGQTSGLGVRFEDVDYHVDLISDRDTESGPVLLGPELPATGTDKKASASEQEAETANLGVSPMVIAGFGALVLVGAGAGAVALRRK